MFYSEYRGRSVGRVMCFLFKMDSSSDDWAHIGFDSKGEGKITYGYSCDPETGKYSDGPVVANFHWLNDSDIPWLTFTEPYIERYQEQWKQALIDVIEFDIKFGKGMWSETRHQEDGRKKKEEYQKRFRENIRKAVADEE